MATINDYLDYAELAQASYDDFQIGMYGESDARYIEVLTKENEGVEFPEFKSEVQSLI